MRTSRLPATDILLTFVGAPIIGSSITGLAAGVDLLA